MGIKLVTPPQRVGKFMLQAREILRKNILLQLSYLGQECVNQIRDRSGDESWYDQTGNLRSSIGAAVYDQGQKTFSTLFEQVGAGADGSNAGKQLVDSLATEYSKTYALVVVAGMNYAAYVEAMDGKDVLASAETYARNRISQYIQDAIDDSMAKINRMRI